MENKMTREEIVSSLPAYNKKVEMRRRINLIASFIALGFVLAVFVYLKFFNTQFEVADGEIRVKSSTAWVVRIPAEYKGQKITKVGDIAPGDLPDARFLYIEDGIESIHPGEPALFGNETIVAVRLPNTLNYISNKAFMKYYALKKVYWDAAPENTVIGRKAFMYTQIRKFVIPEGVTAIGDMCFYQCEKLEKVTMPDTLTKLGVGAFAYCGNLETVQLPKKIDLVSDFLFSECLNLKTVEMGDNIRAIGRFAFYNTSVTEEQFPDDLYYAAYHTADAMNKMGRKRGWYSGSPAKVVLLDKRGDDVNSEYFEYETIFYDKEKEKEFFVEKNKIPPEVFEEPADSDRIWIEGTYYKLPLKHEDFFANGEWEIIDEEKRTKDVYYRLKHIETGHVMDIYENTERTKIENLVVRYHMDYCCIVLPGGIPMGDSLGHRYCMEDYLPSDRNTFITDSETFLIGPKDNPVECEYIFDRVVFDQPTFILRFI